jgi:hypothetical protein
MGIEKIKRWHWCVIGVICGVIYASVKLWAGVEEPEGNQTMSAAEFEAEWIERRDIPTNRPVYKVSNLVVHAATDMALTGGRGNVEFASYDVQLIVLPKPVKPGQRRPSAPAPGGRILADDAPYQRFLVVQKPTGRSIVDGDVTKMSVREYLEKLKAKIAADPKRFEKVPPIEYKYNWHESPKAAFTIFGGAGLVIVGIIWPTLLSLLVSLGFGKAPPPKETFDLSRFKGSKEPEKAKAVVTARDIDKLKKLEEELEASLKDGAKERVHQEAAPVAVAPVKALNAGPAEVPKADDDKKNAPRKGYGADQGDYYPTEVHGKKKP